MTITTFRISPVTTGQKEVSEGTWPAFVREDLLTRYQQLAADGLAATAT